MITFAGDQNDGMQVAVGKKSRSHHLSVIVDDFGLRQLQTSARTYKIVQVKRGSLVPNDRSCRAEIAGERLAHDLTFRVDGERDAEAISGQGAQVRDHSVSPQRRVYQLISKSCGKTDNLAFIVKPVCT